MSKCEHIWRLWEIRCKYDTEYFCKCSKCGDGENSRFYSEEDREVYMETGYYQ